MKTTLTPEPQNQLLQMQAVKSLLMLSLVLSLSACGSIQYNGFSNADTIADLFSINGTKDSAIAENDESTQQSKQVAEQQMQQEIENNEAAIAYFSKLDPENGALRDELNVASQTENMPSEKPLVKEKEAAIVAGENVSLNVAQTETPRSEPVDKGLVVTAAEDNSEIEVPADVERVTIFDANSDATQVAGTTDVDENTSLSIAAIEEVNRLTAENPTAAMSNDYQVLPDVQTEAVEISVPNELLLLAGPAEYRPEVSEYGMWEIAQGEDSLYRENCTLASATMQVSFDNYSTQVWLKVVGNDLLVNSTTNIDINKPRVGIKLDNGPVLAFNKKHFNTSAVWSGNLATVLKRYKELSVSLTGNELGGRIQEVTVELDDLKRAYSEYTKCNATTQIGSL